MEEHKDAGVRRDLLQYYQIRMAALSQYSNLVWMRFNWLLTLQIAIVGFYFGQANRSASSVFTDPGIPIIGLIVAGLWTAMAAQDFISMRSHKKTASMVLEQLTAHFVPARISMEPNGRGTYEFRQTWMLIFFPLLVSLLWTGVLVFA